MTLVDDFSKMVFLIQTWHKFIAVETLQGQKRATGSYNSCRKGAEQGNRAAFNQWERWLQYWTAIRLTQ